MKECGIKKLEWQDLTPVYGKLIVEPFRRGNATTIGNSIRRILLSSIEGVAITSVKIDGILHEFTAIPGVVEDPIDFILNIRGIVFKYEGDEKKELFLEAGKGAVSAGMIKTPADVIIVNPEHYLATVSEGKLKMEMELERGVGYVPALEEKREKRIGVIPIDTYFSPIKRVNLVIENVRIGQTSDYERLVLEITTNGSIGPKEAVIKTASILSDWTSFFINPEPFEIKEEMPEKIDEEREMLRKILNTSIDELEISVRASNCLRLAGIIRIGDIAKMEEQELLKMKNFGRKSLTEVKEKLAEYSLTLSMPGVDELLEPLSEEEIQKAKEGIIKKDETQEEISSMPGVDELLEPLSEEEIQKAKEGIIKKDETQEEIS
ncbi:MAG: DNA-directed RNA polymerase subunit alpha [bacterium]